MGCLDPDSLQELVGGGLAGSARAAAEAHLDTCDECRAVVASLARQSTDDHAKRGVAHASTLHDRVTRPTNPPPRPPVLIALPPGSMVGRYRVKDTLGAGGMGVVYRAEDPELGREVAIKLLRGDRAGPEEERRLVREGQALARVSHPNVIAVHDVGTYDGRVFVAMELVDGVNLRRWLADKRRSIAEVIGVLAAAGRGLAAAHAAGLVHRDFKPDNVLVGRDGRVRVTDFGLARPERPRGGATSGPITVAADAPVDVVLTREGAIVGSPAYMAPEQLEGDHVDARSDQFGFCVTLYEALYGERPFGGKTLLELEANVSKGAVAPPPPGRQVPKTMRAIALRGLAVRPGDRFPSMDMLLAALGRSRALGLRIGATVAASLALAAAVGMFADWLARERQLLRARSDFEASAAQLDKSIELRRKSFETVAELARTIPLVYDVISNRDESEFGFGTPEQDRARLAEMHDNMREQHHLDTLGHVWQAKVALSDYKGRLVYTSAAPDKWGSDVTALPLAAKAMTPGVIITGAVVRGDDPQLIESGLTGGTPQPDAVVVFARQFNAGEVPLGLFLQVVDTTTLLSDVAIQQDTRVAIAHPSGEASSALPADVMAAAVASPGGTVELERDGTLWLVHGAELRAPRGSEPIARIVAARIAPVTGLFAGAKLAFAFAFAGSLALAGFGFVMSRRSARLLGAVSDATTMTGGKPPSAPKAAVAPVGPAGPPLVAKPPTAVGTPQPGNGEAPTMQVSPSRRRRS